MYRRMLFLQQAAQKSGFIRKCKFSCMDFCEALHIVKINTPVKIKVHPLKSA